MSDSPRSLYQQVEKWLEADKSIQSAVLFGSSARQDPTGTDQWSDIDLHIITSDARKLLEMDWAKTFPGLGYQFKSLRPATGGVEKLTIIFATGQIDLIIVPGATMRLARLGMRLGMHRWHNRLKNALEEIQICLRSGFKFLKGQSAWGSFYQQVATAIEGGRLSDDKLCALADVSLSDILWIRQKLARGELCAAQHVLHRSVAETNFRLLRELRLRRGEELPSFGLGRHVEQLLPAAELGWVKIDARCEPDALRNATQLAADGLKKLMSDLVPRWEMPELST